MLLQIGVGGNALEARFEKTIRLRWRTNSAQSNCGKAAAVGPGALPKLKDAMKVGGQSGLLPSNSGANGGPAGSGWPPQH